MRRALIIAVPLVLLAALALAAFLTTGCRNTPADVHIPKEPGGNPHRDITFVVASDTHLGHDGIEALNRRQIAAMNALPGKDWPAELGGTVDRPRGVVITGDLTQHGLAGEWDDFVKLYGLTGEAELNYPVYLLTGNHDRALKIYTPVLSAVEDHHGALVHGWVWDDVLFLALDEYPHNDTLDWLARQLERAKPDMPVVLFMHYGILGPYSDWWDEDEKQAFADVIAGHNVVAIFHGHYHRSDSYRWAGVDIINVGSPRHSMHSFATVRMTGEAIHIASWNWETRGWQWAKRIALPTASPAE